MKGSKILRLCNQTLSKNENPMHSCQQRKENSHLAILSFTVTQETFMRGNSIALVYKFQAQASNQRGRGFLTVGSISHLPTKIPK